MKRFNTFLLFISLLVAFNSCEKEDSGENKTMISYHDDHESHKDGQDCMNCHRMGGNGKGWFVTAGSVYNSSQQTPYPNAKVKLYTGENGTGTLVAIIEVDGKGNFYSTENLDFGNGLYTTVTGTNGKIKTMNSPVTSGSCNSCHGNSRSKIWVE